MTVYVCRHLFATHPPYDPSLQVSDALAVMSGKEFLIDAVAQFLQSSAWVDAVTEFLETHFRKFLVVLAGSGSHEQDTSKELKATCEDEKQTTQSYSLEQYNAFLLFKDLVERLLEQVIADLGCSGGDLVEVLEESARLGEHASEERRFFIQTLLSFEDYGAFAEKISQFAAEKLDELSTTNDEDATPEYSEWILQLAIAKSILESKERGELDETEEGFVSWAEALVEMSQHSTDTQAQSQEAEDEGEAKAADDENVASSAVDDRMKELEQTLIRERLKVDLLVAQRIADANAYMKQQMLHLVASEVDDQLNAEQQQQPSNATASENELAGLFAQTETIQTRLKQIKGQCFEFKSVMQPEMDTMYLFLKEKVHYQQDLVSQEKEIFEFIFSQIQQSDAGLVPLLLEWLLLESEGLRVQNQIQDQLNGVHDDGYWVQDWDEGSQAFFYVHSVTGESKWEPPVCGYMDMNQEFVSPTWDGYGEAQSIDAGTEEEVAQTMQEELGAAESKDSDSEAAAQSSALVNEAATQLDATLKYTNGGDASQLLEMESVMERISREHDEERRRLELLFQVEKARQKEELRKRKEKKRRERLTKKKNKAAVEDVDSKDESTEAAKGESTTQQDPPLRLLSPRPVVPQSPRMVSMKAENKDDDGRQDAHDRLSIMVPGHGRMDLTHLLSDSHAKHFQDRKGLLPLQQLLLPAPQALLNPSTLRYLTEKMIKKDPTNWGLSGTLRQQEIFLEEVDPFAADEK